MTFWVKIQINYSSPPLAHIFYLLLFFILLLPSFYSAILPKKTFCCYIELLKLIQCGKKQGRRKKGAADKSIQVNLTMPYSSFQRCLRAFDHAFDRNSSSLDDPEFRHHSCLSYQFQIHSVDIPRNSHH